MGQARSQQTAAQRSAWILTASALLFSGMALFAKASSSRLPGPQVASLRFLIGLAVALLPLLVGRRLRPKNHLALLLRGVLGSGAVLLYFLAIAHLPVGIATLLNSSWPIFGGLFAFLFLHEPMTRQSVLALLLTSLGVLLVVGGGSQLGEVTQLDRHSLLWALGGLGSAVLSGAAVTTVRSMRQSEGAWEIFVVFCLVGSLSTAIPSALSWVSPTATDLLWLLAMGACAAAAQLTMTYALRDLPAVTAGIILQLTPIATLLFGVILFAERPTPIGWLGALLTILGVTWATASR